MLQSLETKWYEYVKKLSATGVVSACLLHGLTAESFPEMTWEACIEKTKDPRFNAVFLSVEAAVAKRLEDAPWPIFKLASVSGCNMVGMRLETRLPVLTVQ